MSKEEQLQRIKRLMIHLCDAIDYNKETEALLCGLLTYRGRTDILRQDIEALYKYVESLR